MAAGVLPNLRVDLFGEDGRAIRSGSGAMSLLGMEAGTYFLRVSTTSTTPLAFSLEVSPPKDSQVIEALNVRDQDLLNGGGDKGDRIIQATRGPKTTIDPVLSSFTNVSLRDAVYRAVNKRAGSTLFASDLASIAYLSVQGTPTSQLTNLNGFENLVNLIALDLPGHNLDANAIGKLQSISKLQTLNLAGSDVQIAEIPKLPKSLRKVRVERVMDGSQVASPFELGMHSLRCHYSTPEHWHIE